MKTIHIGEVQASVWPQDMINQFKEKGIEFLYLFKFNCFKFSNYIKRINIIYFLNQIELFYLHYLISFIYSLNTDMFINS